MTYWLANFLSTKFLFKILYSKDFVFNLHPLDYLQDACQQWLILYWADVSGKGMITV